MNPPNGHLAARPAGQTVERLGRVRTVPVTWQGVALGVDASFRGEGTLTGMDTVRVPALRPWNAGGTIKLLLDAIWVIEGMLADRLNPPAGWDLQDLRTSQARSAPDGAVFAVVDALVSAQAEERARAEAAVSRNHQEEVPA